MTDALGYILMVVGALVFVDNEDLGGLFVIGLGILLVLA